MRHEIKEEILNAVAEAEKNGLPPVESMFEDVFAELTPNLQEQKQYLLDYRKRHPSTSEVE